jgi:MFS family permease
MNKHSSKEEELSADVQPVTEMTPLPRYPFFVICCVVLSESFSITMIFPFLAHMVRDFGVAENEEDIGFYAGWIASSFNLAQFIAAFMWGMFAFVNYFLR